MLHRVWLLWKKKGILVRVERVSDLWVAILVLTEGLRSEYMFTDIAGDPEGGLGRSVKLWGDGTGVASRAARSTLACQAAFFCWLFFQLLPCLEGEANTAGAQEEQERRWRM
jgi:hypothetical protein